MVRPALAIMPFALNVAKERPRVLPSRPIAALPVHIPDESAIWGAAMIGRTPEVPFAKQAAV